MKLKNVFRFISILLVAVMSGCSKDMVTNPSTVLSPAVKSADLLARRRPLPVVNLGVAGNFAILSKSGITDVYKSSVTGDVGTSPITGAAIHLTCKEVVGTIYSVNA